MQAKPHPRPLSRLASMARLSALIFAFALGTGTALGLVACGGESADLLPGATASQIESNLDEVQRLVDEGDCIGAEDAARQVQLQIEDVGGVDEKLKQALLGGAARLNEVVGECEEATGEETEIPVETDEEVEPVEADEDAEKDEEKEKAKEESEEPAAPAKEGLEEAEGEGEEAGEAEPTLPPQANGEAKGLDENGAEAPADQGGSSPAGGLGPATPTGGE
jgi:hypothetical protein